MAEFSAAGQCKGTSDRMFWHVQEIAGSLMGLLQAAASSAQASAATKERLNRVVQTLSPIAASALPPEPAPLAEAREHAHSSDGTEIKQSNGDLAAAPGAARPAPVSTGEHILRIPPAMNILDRCSTRPALYCV